jgi:hypothetical protein
VVSLEGGEFIVIAFYYFITSDICPDKRGGLPWGSESLLSLYFTISLHQKSVLIRGVVSLEREEFIVIVFYYFMASEICPDKRGGFPWGGGGYGFLFRSEFFFRTTRELEYFFFVAQSANFFFQNSTIPYFGIYHKELYSVDILCENSTSTMPVSRGEGWVFSCLSSYI